MSNHCICITCAARYHCPHAIPGTATGCELHMPATPSAGCRGKAQNGNHKSRIWWLKLAKQERQHAYQNKSKCSTKGDTYGVQVYTVRIKALDLYIKSLQNNEA